MIDQFAKEYLHSDLRDVRATMIWKLEGLSEYDVRRPDSRTGTNLLGLIKHLIDHRGLVLRRRVWAPVSRRLPWRDGAPTTRRRRQLAALFDTCCSCRHVGDEMSRASRSSTATGAVWEHSDATIATLDIDAPGHVPWWPRPDVKLFNIMVHVLTETNRHAGHADILREQLDGAVGTEAGSTALHGRDTTFWENHRAKIERAARAADPAQA